MSAQKRVTLQDIADALGISRGTVDRVMHGRGRVAAATQDRIIQKARELGYVPNQSARMLALRRTLRIAVLRPARPSAFFQAIAQGVRTANDELLGFGLTVEERTTGAHDVDLQADQLKEVIDEGFDGIALIPAHRSRLNPIISQAVASGIPLVTFNTDAPESERLLFVGQDLYRSGRVAGELLGRFVGGTGRVTLLTGFAGLWAHQERVRGITDSIAEYFPDVQITGPLEFHDDVERAATFTRRLLAEDPSIRGFVSTAGSGHVAVARVLLERSLAGTVQNIGYDLDDEIRDLMHRNAIQASIGQDPFSQGYYAVKLLFHHLTSKGEQETGAYHTRIEVLLRSTIDDLAPENELHFRIYSRGGSL